MIILFLYGCWVVWGLTTSAPCCPFGCLFCMFSVSDCCEIEVLCPLIAFMPFWGRRFRPTCGTTHYWCCPCVILLKIRATFNCVASVGAWWIYFLLIWKWPGFGQSHRFHVLSGALVVFWLILLFVWIFFFLDRFCFVFVSLDSRDSFARSLPYGVSDVRFLRFGSGVFGACCFCNGYWVCLGCLHFQYSRVT